MSFLRRLGAIPSLGSGPILKPETDEVADGVCGSPGVHQAKALPLQVDARLPEIARRPKPFRAGVLSIRTRRSRLHRVIMPDPVSGPSPPAHECQRCAVTFRPGTTSSAS